MFGRFFIFSFLIFAGGLLSAAAAPTNDNFANALEISAGSLEFVNGTTAQATKEPNEPNHAGKSGLHSVWYKWTNPAFFTYNGGMTFTVRDLQTNFDSVLAVYTGTSLNNLTLVAANDDYGSTPTALTSTVFFEAKPGTTYYIVVDGFNNNSGNFRLHGDINRTHSRSSRFGSPDSPAISVFRQSNGTWYETGASGFKSAQFGQFGDVPVPADYDGDNKTDFAVFRPSNNAWYVLQSSTGTFRAVIFGLSGDKPVTGDYTGNGYDDFAVFRPSNGTWYVQDGKTNAFSAAQFGQAGDKPAARDYDADGKLDLTVFRPSDGNWYFLNSRDNSFIVTHFGISEDVPVPGGYNSTGRADIAVWRPSTGFWYLLNSSHNSFQAYQWGKAGDIPQPLDYGSGGLTDLGIYRPSNGTWYILETDSGNKVTSIAWGAAGDLPTAAAYPIQQ